MKKIVTFLIATLLLTGCTSGVSQSEYDKVVQERDALKTELAQLKGDEVVINSERPENEIPQTGTFDKESITKQLAVTDYIIDGKYSDYVVTVIKNPSNFDLGVKINQNYKDVDGNIIGAESFTDHCLPANGEIAVWTIPDDLPTTVENSVDVKKSMYTGFQNLDYETSLLDKKAIISATNNDSKPISFLEYKVIFFNGDTAVGIETGYIMDADNELKSGDTLTAEAKESQPFDNIKVYFSGYIR